MKTRIGLEIDKNLYREFKKVSALVEKPITRCIQDCMERFVKEFKQNNSSELTVF